MKALQAKFPEVKLQDIEKIENPTFMQIPATLYLDILKNYSVGKEAFDHDNSRGFYVDPKKLLFEGTLILAGNQFKGYCLKLYAGQAFYEVKKKFVFIDKNPFFEVNTRIESSYFESGKGWLLTESCDFKFNMHSGPSSVYSMTAQCTKFAARIIHQIEGAYMIFQYDHPKDTRFFREYWEKDIFPGGNYQ